MDTYLKTLFVDAGTGFYRLQRFRVGDFFGPVDLGLHLAGRYNSLNIGVGLLAGSIFPGTNRLIVTGFSPCWGGFFVSSMGGAGLVFDNLGLNMVSIIGNAPTPSVLARSITLFGVGPLRCRPVRQGYLVAIAHPYDESLEFAG